MNVLELLHKTITAACPSIHQTRLTALIDATQAAMTHQKVSLTGLGRTLSSPVKTKHNIKRVDRLLGNAHLHGERDSIYQAMLSYLLGRQPYPIILIDWSQINEEAGFHILRASIPMDGRALTLYEEAHPCKLNHNRHVHEAFLTTLKSLLMDGITPIIVTDAGFKNPWFKQVEQLGWYWLGRIRHTTNYRAEEQGPWHQCYRLYEQATDTPQSLGKLTIAKSNPLHCHAYLYKKPIQGRKKLTQGKRPSKRAGSCKYARREREPWFLVSNCPSELLSSQQAVYIYRARMQIEESFRDNKNQRIGLSLKESKSRTRERLQILLLITTLATFALWIIGKAAHQRSLHFNYQANTIRHRPVLSHFNLGLQVWRKEPYAIPGKEIALLFRCLVDFTFKWQ